MTVRIARGQLYVIFDLSDERDFRITKTSAEQSKTFVYGVADSLETILNELEWLVKYHPGIFRLLWFYVVDWPQISEIFYNYAKTYSVSL